MCKKFLSENNYTLNLVNSLYINTAKMTKNSSEMYVNSKDMTAAFGEDIDTKKLNIEKDIIKFCNF